MPTVTDSVTVHCKGCGEPRQVSYRQSRRAGLCPLCLFPPNVKVTRAHRRYWLKMYSDAEIAAIASEFLEVQVPVETVSRQRLALAASSRRTS